MPYFGIPIRNGLPIGLGSVAGFGVAPAFSPSVLFTAGEQGAWYDPSDLTTLFQDASGTTPVTGVEQYVRLMLDKSKGLVLGPELVTNGDFSSSANWTLAAGGGGSATIANGLLTLSGGAAAFPNATQSGILTSGRWYRVTVVTTSAVTSNSLGLRVGGLSTQFSGFTAAGTYTRTIQADGTDLRLIRNSGFTDTADVDSISVQELPGNHATAPSDPARPILRARYNLLTYSEQFNDVVWQKNASATVTANAATAPNGTLTADQIDLANDELSRVQQPSTAVEGTYTFSVWLRVPSGSASIRFGHSADLDVITVTSTWQRFVKVATITGGNSPNITIRNESAAGAKTLYAWGADLRFTNDALNMPAYQRVAAATDYDTAGFLPYLEFNGSTWSMSTSAINFGSTDKMTVFAGVRKLSDAADGMLIELSANISTNNGSFYITAPESSASLSYAFLGRGAGGINANQRASTALAAYPAPVTNVLATTGDIFGDLNTIRVNGIAGTSATGDQGAGNYGNHPLFIGARNNASVWFTGRIYSLTIVGRAVNSGELAAMEAYVNQKTAAY